MTRRVQSCYITNMNRYISSYINRAEFSSEPITVNSCGNYLITDQNFRTYRECGTSDYQLVYVRRGELVDNAAKTHVSDETAIFFAPHQKHDYVYVAEKSTDVFWIHFGGSGVEELLASYGISADNVYRLTSQTPLDGYFNDVIHEITRKNDFYKESSVLSLRKILITLGRCAKLEKTDRSVPGAFNKVLEQMYVENIKFNVDDCAKLCCVSPSRFAHYFKQKVGMSPHAFHAQIVAGKAKDLVMNSELNIGEIAETLGFTDIYYFSRFYKKYFGVSPLKHRKS